MSRGVKECLEKYGSMAVGENRPIRILYIVPGSPGGSSMMFAHNEITRIRAYGIETRTFIFSASLNLRAAWTEAMILPRIVRRYKPELVHAHFGTITAFTCATTCYAPLVITYRGSDLNPSPSDGRLRSAGQKLLSHFAALRASAIICVSSQLKERLSWCRGKVSVIPSGVDLQVFRPIPKSKARRLLNWQDEERIVLFNAGTAPAVKRLDLAEKSVAVMRKLIGDVRFVVLTGNTPHSEMPLYFNGADCLLMTSDYEGSPDIIKEALACCLPIVSVEAGDVVDRLEGVYPSRIVVRDPCAIASAAAEILLSGQRSNGRERISDLSAETVVRKILAVYQGVLGNKPKSG